MTTHIPQRDTPARRGNVIILAVAVLAIMAVSAASYVTITRLDSANSRAYSRRGSFGEQTRTVTGYIQAVIAADLFGNKIVTNAVPRRVNNSPNWPDMFEDGEHWDYPTTKVLDENNSFEPLYNFRVPTSPSQLPRANDSFVLDPRAAEELRLAYPDDAWLASTEPTDLEALDGVARSDGTAVVDGGSNLPSGLWDAWPQVTNLKTAYEWDARQNGQIWVRGDGRYVDLANFFLSDQSRTQGRGDPGADLWNLSQDPTYGGTPYFAMYGETELQAEPSLEFGLKQPVYHMQMNLMHEWIASAGVVDADAYVPPSATDAALQGDYQQVDLRMWVDTDGDGRPDARWQELDALGSALGMRWVVAARIIDSSSMVNVNSSIGFGDLSSTANPETIGSGITPADIDLYRLVDTTMFSQNQLFPAHPDLSLMNAIQGTARVRPGYNELLSRGLNLVKHPNQPDTPTPDWILDEINTDVTSGTNNPVSRWNETLARRDKVGAFLGWDISTDGNVAPTGVQIFQSPLKVTRDAKEAYYRFVGVSPQDSPLGTANPFPLSDEIDLRAFWGLNYNTAVSKLEQRLDGPEGHPQFDRLPGQTATWPRNSSVGVMRSAELPQDVSTTNNMAALPVSNGSPQNYDQTDKVQRIERDLRRLLTTYSGVGYVSPVSPKNNLSAAGGASSTVKLTPNAFPDPLDRITDEKSYDQRMSAFLQDATGAFMWALAPFATDRPLMRGAPYGVVESENHYGNGGVNSPASRVESEINGSNDIGAMYPLIRAASLAVNLVDAQDYADGDPETPTVLRIFREYDVTTMKPGTNGTTGTGALNQTIRNDEGVAEIGVSFAHGDLPLGGISSDSVDALPRSSGGGVFPDNGVLLAGLDSQPFLVGAYTFEYFALEQVNDLSWPTANYPELEIVPDDPAQQVGSIFAVKIGNPWPDDGVSGGIDVSEYVVILTNGTEVIEFDLGDSDDPIIPFGETAIYYYEQEGISGAPASWSDIWDQWQADLGTRMGDANRVRKLNSANGPSVGTDGRFYESFGSSAASLLLVHESNLASNGIPSRILVDRMTPAGSDSFPVAQQGAFVVPDTDGVVPAPPQDGNFVAVARMTAEATFLRPGDTGVGSGFPAYVIERPLGNITTRREAADGGPGDTYGLEVSGSDTYELLLASGYAWGERDQFENIDASPPPTINATPASFQLFVPNSGLLTPSEILRISEFAHMYFGNSYALGFDTTSAATRGNPTSAWPSNVTTDPWRTVSEQLGADAHFYWDGTTQNPFLGTVQYARHLAPAALVGASIFDPGADNIPDQLLVPFGARLVDVFEPLVSRSSLVHGKVNINTAPDRVIRALPLMDPKNPSTYISMATTVPNWASPDSGNAENRIEWIRSYRNGWTNWPKLNGVQAGGFGTRPESITNIDRLRKVQATTDEPEAFVSVGELALIGRWDREPTSQQALAPAPAVGDSGMFELGLGAQKPDVEPLDIRFAFDEFDGANDTEERLTLFQAISNVVSTRSDVFTAWYVIRAYDPKAIEAITIEQNLDDNERAALLNELSPAYESRWLVVFDRSNIRQPTDRPRIIMSVELPSTSP